MITSFSTQYFIATTFYILSFDLQQYLFENVTVLIRSSIELTDQKYL